jgi:hypothetical protein
MTKTGVEMLRNYNWNSADLFVPIDDFARIFNLTKSELRREAGNGRIAALGLPIPNGYARVGFHETEIQRWLVRPDLPKSVARKIKNAGGVDRLTAWRDDYFSKITFTGDGDLILPNGERITDVRISPRVSEH